MIEEELIEFLKKNLTIEVQHPKWVSGDFCSSDEHNITVKIKLCGKILCEDRSYSDNETDLSVL